MSDSVSAFKKLHARIECVRQAAGLLDWDQQTYMPEGAAEARANQSAALKELAHETLVSDAYAGLLAGLEAEARDMHSDSDERRMAVVARRDFDRAAKLPSEFVAELAHHSSLAQNVWMRARQANSFDDFAPSLERMLELKRQEAEYFGYSGHIYDALLEGFEPGARHAEMTAMFDGIKGPLVALTKAIGLTGPPPHEPTEPRFPVEAQRQLTMDVVRSIGFDMHRGRQDEAAHPFCSNFSRDDVRITTRFSEAHIGQGLYASLHEAGHGMYEQGSPPRFEGTPLAGGVSLGVHESQSRFWENIIGRGAPFCEFIFPRLQKAFPAVYSGTTWEAFYRSVNVVAPSLIRVEADEVTYNLHVLLRFEIESRLLEGTLAVRDLPDAWNTAMEEYLGVTPPDDATGVLQDVHWSIGLIGYFPTYTLGNLISAQLWNRMREALPGIENDAREGMFDRSLGWLRENIHACGRKYRPGDLIARATGQPIDAADYIGYVTKKYTSIYNMK